MEASVSRPRGPLVMTPMFQKVLVANRGEIAVRAFRAAYELGFRTVAVFPYEDRNADHRVKALESYLIGEEGHPVRAYLDIDEIIRAAKEAGADAIYPGYGFLSENPDLARACAANGITFIGPSAGGARAGRQQGRRHHAGARGGHPDARLLPAVHRHRGADRGRRRDRLPRLHQGRRRRRWPRHAPGRRPASASSRRTGRGHARGRGRVRRRHRLHRAGRRGTATHRGADPGRPARQRDAPVRAGLLHPAPPPEGDRDRAGPPHLAGAARRAHLGRGEVRQGHQLHLRRHRRVPRRDRGRARRAARVHRDEPAHPGGAHRHRGDHRRRPGAGADAHRAGETLDEIGIRQDELQIRGAALQCRITTEDPQNSFRPDTGLITAYRSASGAGIRLDGGTTGTGVEISPHFDSLLVKLTARGRDFPMAVARARRALAEFRVRGVATNIPFLRAVLDDPEFEKGGVTTSFIDERPYLPPPAPRPTAPRSCCGTSPR